MSQSTDFTYLKILCKICFCQAYHIFYNMLTSHALQTNHHFVYWQFVLYKMIVTLTNPHLKEILATFNLSTLYTRLITLISHSLCEISSSAPCVCKPITHHHIYQSLIKHLPKTLNMPMEWLYKTSLSQIGVGDPLSNHFFQHILLLNLLNVFLRIPPNW